MCILTYSSFAENPIVLTPLDSDDTIYTVNERFRLDLRRKSATVDLESRVHWHFSFFLFFFVIFLHYSFEIFGGDLGDLSELTQKRLMFMDTEDNQEHKLKYI
ncbi:unnamed protein product [Albugo candida]|uniref:Uncharacterized protein n=1 Tax=Albugo candida TaxID=65357 RepID=A0A024FUN2_9STRA|nr:unnamed protein product [Albugo candida]|eukprot:CCI10617.1 unnamed protein product [Albugo candida]